MKKAGLDRRVMGQNICRMRKAHGWSQSELGRRAKLSESQVFRLEHGINRMSTTTFFSLCHALGCTPKELLQGAE